MNQTEPDLRKIDRPLEERSIETEGPEEDTQSDRGTSHRAEAVGTSVGLGRKFRYLVLSINSSAIV